MIGSATLSAEATRGLTSSKSANVKVVAAARRTSSPAKLATPIQVMVRVTQGTVRAPVMSAPASSPVGRGTVRPPTAVGRNVAVGKRAVCSGP